MPKTGPFQKYPERYDRWFDENRLVYEAELRAVRTLIPDGGWGMEIGVGSGRFASPLGLRTGVDPSMQMMDRARRRGVEVVGGSAEKLPFRDSTWPLILMVTTVCFLDNINESFSEAFRVLSDDGYFIVAFVDQRSPVGSLYRKHRKQNVFYETARFYQAGDIIDAMRRAGFGCFDCRQTIFGDLSDVAENEPVKEGCDEGSFVVVRGRKRTLKR